jgi:hypothetical protein
MFGCLILAGFRVWCCLCAFPEQEWNDVRLRAAFLIADGLPLYPGLHTGPITTWIYGPVLPLLMLPVTFASEIETVLMLAGVMNAFLLCGTIAFTCLLWPAPAGRSWSRLARLGALGLTLLLLPQTFFIFIQADNTSLAFGLISLTSLARAHAGNQKLWWWLAAATAGAAAFSKLHGVTLPMAELAWLWFAGSRSQFRQFLGKLALVGAGLILITLGVAATPSAAWTMMVKIPAHLPFASDLGQRCAEMLPYYVQLVGLPLLLLLLTKPKASLFSSTLSLPVFAWLASLPLGLAGTLTWGGAYNSLHGAFFALPIILVVLLAQSPLPAWPHRALWVAVWVLAPFVILGTDKVSVWQLPKIPALQMPREATLMAGQQGDRTWMPWRPLAMRLATGRHDHDEDGLHIRQLTGFFPGRTHAFSQLPPRWDQTMFQLHGMNHGIARAMHQTETDFEVRDRWIWLVSR